MPIRPEDDKAVLRTDGSVDQTQAYTAAEKIFDPADQPQQAPKNLETHKTGGVATSGTHQAHQMETSEKEDPSKAAHDADPTDV
jgi:hypothetical protein